MEAQSFVAILAALVCLVPASATSAPTAAPTVLPVAASGRFLDYVALGLPRATDVMGYWGFDDPARPLIDTSGRNNHLVAGNGNPITLVNLSGGAGHGMAYDIANLTAPSLLRVPVNWSDTLEPGLGGTGKLTICATVRFLKTRQSQFVAQQAVSGLGCILCLPNEAFRTNAWTSSFARTVQVALGHAGAANLSGRHNTVIHRSPPGGRFAQVCVVSFNTRLYVDGWLPQQGIQQPVQSGGTNPNSGDFLVGWSSVGSGEPSGPLPLQFDEIIMWRGMLSRTEVLTYYGISQPLRPPRGGLTAAGPLALIARYTFDNGTLANSVPNSPLGEALEAFGLETASSEAVSPGLSARNYSGTPTFLSNYSSRHGQFLRLNNATLLTTPAGGVGWRAATLCFNFYRVSDFFTLPCFDAQLTPEGPGPLVRGYQGDSQCYWSESPGRLDIVSEAGSPTKSTFIDAYALDAWNRMCVSVKHTTTDTTSAAYVNGALLRKHWKSNPEAQWMPVPVENMGIQLPPHDVLIDEVVVYGGTMTLAEAQADYGDFMAATPSAAPTTAPSTQ